jgi:polysaccharide chain length determinant protein (PEP-CTERM system associated)
MLPGKKVTPEDVLRIAIRRRWLLILPLVLGTSAAWVWATRQPDLYRSETLIMLAPQRIPDSYVKTTVTNRIEDRLATLSDQILSRSRLERIILDLDIYSVQRKNGPMEDIIQGMRHDIDIKVEGKESFRVSYISGTALTAQKVTERLASLFIEENLRDRENVAEDTNRFLESQLEDAKRRLIEQEKKLEGYRRRYSGQLPSQLQANLQGIQTVEAQRSTIAQAADRNRERRLQYERQLSELQTPDPTAAVVASPAPQLGSGGGPENLAGATTGQQLEAAREALRLLRLRNTADHPDVRIMERRIRDLENKLKTEAPALSTGETPEPVSPAEIIRQRRIRDLTAQIADVNRQLKEYEAEDRRLQSAIRDYQTKVEAVPTRESELVELTRDYATLQNSYQSLLAKREESKIAANLERRNIGEQFRILDPARVPERPFSPDRRKLTLIGAAAGLGLGLFVVGFLEYRDSTFRTDDDIVRTLALPVLAVVPLVLTLSERRVRRRRTVGAAALVLTAGVAAAVTWWRMQS